ncbi:MAG: magnesium transporter [Alphaproteobacteria bacterium]|nr:magnesium transporter [Alphaproteobacteria bacterium]
MAEPNETVSGPQTEGIGEAEPLYGLTTSVARATREALVAGDGARVRRLVRPLHYSDQADLIERFNHGLRRDFIDVMRGQLDAEVLTELDESVREEVVQQLGAQETAAAVSELDSDDVVHVLEDLDEQVQQQVLEALPAEDRALVEENLSYPEDSAGRLMQRELVAIPAFWTVGETIDHMRESTDLPDDFYDIIVVDPKHQPVGTIPLNRIMRTRRPVRVNQIRAGTMFPIPAATDQEEVARLFRQHDLVSAPVVDGSGRLVGIITVDDVVDVIDEEAEEDLMRLAGVGETDVYHALIDTARSRFSWLAVNLVTAILASFVIGLFEGTIKEIVALAVLMPIVASMGGNAGTQTLTVAVRALAMRELSRQNAWRFVFKELFVGGINGILFAVLAGLCAGLWFQSVPLGGVIAGAMVVNLIVAGLSGTLIPLGLERLGVDPAIASSVFLTTVTDVIGFLAFLGLATLFLL